jgi:S-DNA-T family DNA segregation ATPase FtsK/SpoIIIE
MSLARIINKTPIQNERNNVYEVDSIPLKLIQKVIQSRFISEGVYSFEQLSMPDYNERYVTAPIFDKLELKPSETVWNFSEDIKDITFYELMLDKPSFLPLDCSKFIQLFEAVTKIKYATIFTQLLITKRVDDWRTDAINAYEEYLKGNTDPVDNKIARKIQMRALKVLNKLTNFLVESDPIEEIESKILQKGYRVEIRFAAYEERYTGLFEKEMNRILEPLRLFNGFSLEKVTSKKSVASYIQDRCFQSYSVNQLLSESEVYSLLGDKKIDEKVSPIPKPIQHSSIMSSIENSQLLQRAIQLMPKREIVTVEVDNTMAKQVNQSFKRVGITKNDMKINTIHQGSSLQRIQMIVPPEITFTTIKRKLEDIQGALGNQNVTIEIGSEPDTIDVYVPLEKREIVYLRNILESPEFAEFKSKSRLPFIIGENVNGGNMFGCLSEMRHLLVSGTNGSGKSVFVTLILLTFLISIPPDELRMYLVDPKLVEFSLFEGFPQVKPIVTDMKKATNLVGSLVDEMERRFEEFKKIGVKELPVYNEKSETKMPYIVCAIDEFADLMMVNPQVEEYVVRLAQKARAAGIHLIICTQRPSVDVITGLIKANMVNRFAFKMTSGVDSRTILDVNGAEKLLGKGDGLCKVEGSKREIERFQSPLLTLDKLEEENLYNELKELFTGISTDDFDLPERASEEPIDKLKRIIANTGETRVSELQRQMGIAIGKVTELMKELVDEEWLTREGRKYLINVDENELNKWRDKDEQ